MGWKMGLRTHHAIQEQGKNTDRLLVGSNYKPIQATRTVTKQMREDTAVGADQHYEKQVSCNQYSEIATALGRF